jgi:GT2 family glycosyltransferase
MSTVDGLDATGVGVAEGPEEGAEAREGVEAEPLAPYPPVVAVVVTRNPGSWFEDTLDGLATQNYPDLTVLVVDCGSDEDPTPRVAAHLPRAFVRHLDANDGFATAANEALHLVEGATFLMLCHDDVVPDPDAVRVLVEEAYRSNAGIVGPKLVTADDPGVLLEVGRAIDRFGAPYTGIEPGEYDQEQHDGVRDVFYVTTATMLVRVDLFEQLGGFDPATFPGAEDLDLCWRARLAGARVLVAPDARVAHREAALSRNRGDRPDESALARSRVRVLLTNYSFLTLLWLVPVGIVVGFVEATADVLTGRHRRARAAITGWFSNLFHWRRLRASRKRVQSMRHVRDRDLRELRIGSATRLNAFFIHHLHADERFQQFTSRSRTAVGSMSDSMRGPAALAFLGFLAMVVVGSRGIISSGMPGIATLVPWPSIGDLYDSFGSAWHYTGVGSATAAPPLLALMGGLGTVLFGAVGLVRTLLVVLAMPIGAIGAYRLTRHLVGLRSPALAAAVAYGVNPVARNAISTGRFGPLVLFALLPFVLGRVVRLCGLDRDVARELGDEVATPAAPRPRGRFLRLALLVALAATCYPVSPALFVLAAVAFLLAAPFAGGWSASTRAIGITVLAALASLVLLFPWPLAYATRDVDAASLGFAFRPDLDLSQLLRFQSGPAGAGWAMWGLVVGAAVPLFVATGARLAWAARAWALAIVGWAVVWVPGQLATDRSMLAPEAGLTLAALGVALALGIGTSVLVDGVRSMRFGWRQPAAILGAVAILLPALGFAADAFDGRWHAPRQGWVDNLAFTDALEAKGEFRILWLGAPSVLPLDPVVLRDGTGYTLTRNGPGDSSELLRAPEQDADHVVDRAVTLARDGLTNRLGRLLAPAGVRWVALPSTQGPDGGAAPAVLPGWRRALDGQLDLARLRSQRGLVLYQNLAWIPLRASVTGPDVDAVPLGPHAAIPAALGTDLSGATPLPAGATAAPGVVLWGEAFDDAWKATIQGTDGDETVVHRRAFGWANGYRVPARGPVAIEFTAQWVRWALLAGALVIWLVVAWWWWRTRVRFSIRFAGDAGDRARARRERRRRSDPLVDAADDETFWWERV